MVSLEKIKISDAKRLRNAQLMEGSLSAIEDEIRTYIDFYQIKVLVAYNGEDPIAMFKLYLLDRKGCHVHVVPVLAPDLDSELYYPLMDRLTHYSLVIKRFHKLTITISSRNSFLEGPITELGFIQESVLTDEILNDGLYEDAGLFRILSADYLNYNVCFIPFDAGVAVVSGSNEYVDGIRLYQFGAKLDDGFIGNVARQLHLVDRDGTFKPNVNGIYDMEEEAIDSLPDMVAKAYYQISNYFSKTLSSFSFAIKFPSGTPFQQSVWKAISDIKYGSTLSYEDIALLVSEGDISKAKNLTRAVGNACSENPLMLAVPCHRVIGKDGKLAGFSAGVEVQDYLLTLEAFSYVTSLV